MRILRVLVAALATTMLAGCPGGGAHRAPNLPSPPPTPGLYANCEEAASYGATPIRSTDPGYDPRMDGDKDGVACE